MDRDIRKKFGKTLLFRYVGEAEREDFLGFSDLLTYAENDAIIREGDDSDHVFIVVDGEVSVTVEERDGRQIYITTIGEGEIFGEAGIFLKTARTANVVSLGDTRVLRIHRNDLLSFIKRYPATGIKILMVIIYGLLKKLRENNQELAYERQNDSSQTDIDDLVESLMRD